MLKMIRMIQPYAGYKIGDVQPASRIRAERLIDAGIAVLADQPTPDDLTLIPGIGPARAAALAGIGIRTYSDLAEADLEDLDAKLDGTTADQIADYQAAAAERIE